MQQAITQGEREIRPEFMGSTGEYFRIWIVNLFFTLATLGIYSAWAKVRKKRYFYGSTRFDGDGFDYFGSPKAILKGRIAAVLVFVIYALAGELFPEAYWVFWGVALLALPWLALRSLAFNARNSAFRGLRFNFDAQMKKALKVYFGMGALVIVTAGLAMPWFIARFRSFAASHHAYGTSHFECELPGKKFFGIYFRSTLILLLFTVPVVAAAGFLIFKQVLPEQWEWVAPLIGAAGFYAGYAIAYAYSQARTGNLMWNSTSAPGLRFESSLSALKLARLYVGNLIAIIASVGLLIPWAVVRTMRYRLSTFAMFVAVDHVHEANLALPAVGAAGQELSDLFNLDIGL